MDKIWSQEKFSPKKASWRWQLECRRFKVCVFKLHLGEENVPPFCQQVRPTRRKHTSANALVLQSRRSTFHAEGTGLRVLEVGYELTKPASHGPTELNNCRVRLFWMFVWLSKSMDINRLVRFRILRYIAPLYDRIHMRLCSISNVRGAAKTAGPAAVIAGLLLLYYWVANNTHFPRSVNHTKSKMKSRKSGNSMARNRRADCFCDM